ncbi:MAG: carboxyl transferase [Oscillospiraceae bacterium]|jgi:acetyl-CoA carboxylase carboxyltransferase component|nr:carboxyl transferase [Oscillospiraceae bacterium]
MSIESKLLLLDELEASSKATAAWKNLSALFDEGEFDEIDAFAKSGEGPAELIAGVGTVEGAPVYAFAQNPDILGGAFSKAQASKLKKLYELAAKTGQPLVGIYQSKGGRLKEGGELLSAYGDILSLSNKLSGVVPQISLILGTCTGTSSLIAAAADIVILKAGEAFGLITSGNNEDAASSGAVQLVEEDEAAVIEKARRIISLLPDNNISAIPFNDFEEPKSGDTSSVFASAIDADSFTELQPDFGSAATVGLATIGGGTAGIVAFNGGEIDAASSSKAARFVRFCDAFSIPLVTFVNTTGFASIREASQLAHSYAEASTAKVSIVTGKAYGAGFIALAGRNAGADLSYAWPQAVIAPLKPQTAINIIWNERLAQGEARKDLEAEYADTLASPFTAAAEGAIEGIIKPENTRAALLSALAALAGKRVTGLPKKHSNIQL